MKYKAVVFDLFGTLIDIFTFTEYHDTLAEMAGMVGIQPEEMIRGWIETAFERGTGRIPTLEENIYMICRSAGVEPKPEQVKAALARREAFTHLYMDNPRQDALETLPRLRDAGYKIGLISDCSQEVPIIFPSTPLAPLIDVPIFSSTAGLKKPDPRIYHLVCEKLGVEPSDCLYVGDGDSRELTGAESVGMHPVRIRAPYESPEAFRSQGDSWEGPGIASIAEVLALAG